MTDAERTELAALEGRLMRRALSADEERRLDELRRERMLGAAVPNPQALKEAIALLERLQRNEWVPYRDVRHRVMLPPPVDEWEEETE
jgi:hypothetical protein